MGRISLNRANLLPHTKQYSYRSNGCVPEKLLMAALILADQCAIPRIAR